MKRTQSQSQERRDSESESDSPQALNCVRKDNDDGLRIIGAKNCPSQNVEVIFLDSGARFDNLNLNSLRKKR